MPLKLYTVMRDFYRKKKMEGEKNLVYVSCVLKEKELINERLKDNLKGFWLKWQSNITIWYISLFPTHDNDEEYITVQIRSQIICYYLF